MDGNISKALWIGVGILFFIGVVTLGLTLFNKGKDVAQKQTESLSQLEKGLAEAEFDNYDNRSVSGAEVVSAIKNFREDSEVMSISVSTKKTTVVYLNSASFDSDSVTLGEALDKSSIETQIKQARSESSDNYINPVAKFDAAIRKDSNGVISGIVFVQE